VLLEYRRYRARVVSPLKLAAPPRLPLGRALVSSRKSPSFSLTRSRNRLKEEVVAHKSLVVGLVFSFFVGMAYFFVVFPFPCLKNPSGSLLAVIASSLEDLRAERYLYSQKVHVSQL